MRWRDALENVYGIIIGAVLLIVDGRSADATDQDQDQRCLPHGGELAAAGLSRQTRAAATGSVDERCGDPRR